jgi:hypothetical protein
MPEIVGTVPYVNHMEQPIELGDSRAGFAFAARTDIA